MRFSKLFKKSLFESSKIYFNSLNSFTNQILNEINNLNSKYLKLSKILISISTNRIFNLKSTNVTLKAFKIFDNLIEKIDFVSKKVDFAENKLTQFSFNIT